MTYEFGSVLNKHMEAQYYPCSLPERGGLPSYMKRTYTQEAMDWFTENRSAVKYFFIDNPHMSDYFYFTDPEVEKEFREKFFYNDWEEFEIARGVKNA